jgi:hypothetical protein
MGCVLQRIQAKEKEENEGQKNENCRILNFLKIPKVINVQNIGNT